MGTIETKQQLPNQKSFTILDYGYCTVWKRNVDSLQLMEQYPLFIQSPQRLKSFQHVWSLRTKNPFFVNVYYFSHSKSQNMCGSLITGSIFTERIPQRLSEFSRIPRQITYLILKNALEGYKILYQNFGLFIVRSTMIGLTDKYKLKIWFHTDFSQPQPQNPNCTQLSQMILSIVHAVQNTRAYYYGQDIDFRQFLLSTNNYYITQDFTLVLKGLDDYIKKFRINIVHNLSEIRFFKKKPEGWQKFVIKNDYPKNVPTKHESKFSSSIDQSRVVHYDKSNTLKRPQNYSLRFANQLENQTTQRMNKMSQTSSERQNIKFWKSSQKVIKKDSQNMNRIIQRVSFTRFHEKMSDKFSQNRQTSSSSMTFSSIGDLQNRHKFAKP